MRENGIGQYDSGANGIIESNTGMSYNWPYTTTWPTQTVVGSVSLWPSYCAGNVHVWACAHTETCQCGVAKRTVPKVTCAACGK